MRIPCRLSSKPGVALVHGLQIHRLANRVYSRRHTNQFSTHTHISKKYRRGGTSKHCKKKLKQHETSVGVTEGGYPGACAGDGRTHPLMRTQASTGVETHPWKLLIRDSSGAAIHSLSLRTKMSRNLAVDGPHHPRAPAKAFRPPRHTRSAWACRNRTRRGSGKT